MNHEIITHTPITMDNGKVVEAYIHKLPSGMYAMHAEYPFRSNSTYYKAQYHQAFRVCTIQALVANPCVHFQTHNWCRLFCFSHSKVQSQLVA